MSSSIDQRVVQMQFDNADFEKNAEQSMTTLDKFKEKLNFSESTKSLEELTSGASKFNLNGMGAGIDEIRVKFSALQVMGVTAIANITNSAIAMGKNLLHNMTSSVTTGGLNRALNLESAKFTLKGIGIAWKDISEDIDYGVKDTAYGLDAAAKAAASLAASGVKVGKDMKQSLRGISGVAAMTNSDYSSMADIFTTVASNGKLMTMQLRQMSARGLNASATLAKSMGKTEAEINDMVTKGEISYKQFAKAMDDAFGEHAKDANKTFTGAMSNVKAALARIGADVASEQLINFRKVLNALRRSINAVHTAIGPVIDDINKFVGSKANAVYKWLNGLVKVTKNADGSSTAELIKPITRSIMNFRKAAHNLGDFVGSIFNPIKQAFKSTFDPITAKTIWRISHNIKEFTNTLTISEQTAKNIRRTFKGVFAVLDIIGQAFNALIRIIKPALDSLGIGKVIDQILYGTAGIGVNLRDLARSWKENDTIYKGFKMIADTLGSAKDRVIDFVDRFTGIKSLFPNVKTLGDFVETIRLKLSNLPEAFSGAGKAIKDFFANLFKGTSDNDEAGDSVDGIGSKFEKLGGILQLFSDILSNISEALGGDVIKLLQNLDFVGIFEGLKSGIELGILKELFDLLNSFTKNVSPGPLLNTAKAVAIMAASLILLSSVDADAMNTSLGALASVLGMLAGTLILLQQMNNSSSTNMDKTPWMKFINSINALNGTSLFGQAKALVAIAGAVFILSGAVVKLAKLDPIKMAQGLVGLAAVLIALTTAANSLDATGMSKSALGMIAMAIAVRILVGAVNSLGKSDPVAMLQGLVGVAAILLAISSFSNSLKNSKNLLAVAAALPAIAVSLLIFSAAVRSFGKIEEDALLQGMLSIAVIMAGISAFSNTLKNTPQLLAASVAMIALGAALNIVALAVKTLGQMSGEQMWQGLVGVAGSLLAIVVAVNAMSSALAGAAAMIIVAAALAIITPQLMALSAIPFDKLMTGVVGLGIALGTIAAIAAIFSTLSGILLVGAGVIAALGAATLIAGAGIALLGVGISTLAASLSAGGTMIVAGITAIGVGLVNLIPMMASALAAGIINFLETLIKGGAKIINALTILGQSLLKAIGTFIGPIGVMGAKLLMSLLAGIASKIGDIVMLGAGIIVGFINGLAAKIGDIIAAGFNLMVQFINGLAVGIVQNGSVVLDAVENLFISIGGFVLEALAGILGKLPIIGDGVKSALLGAKDELTKELNAEEGAAATNDFAEGVSEKLDIMSKNAKTVGEDTATNLTSPLESLDITSTTTMLKENALSGIKDLPMEFGDIGNQSMEELTKSLDFSNAKGKTGDLAKSLTGGLDGLGKTGTSKGEDLGSGIADGISKKEKDVKNAAKSLGEKGAKSVKDTRKDYVASGEYTGGGIAEGIGNKADEVTAKAAHLAHLANQAYRDNLQIKSPSKVMAENGKWTVLGIIAGFDKYMSKLEDAGGELGQKASDAASRSLNSIDSMFDFEMDYNPTITPVLDLSNVHNGISSMNRSFGNQTIGVDASVSRLGVLSANIDKIQNGANNELFSAIRDLKSIVDSRPNNNYNINGVTYDDGSNIANAMQAIANAAIIEGRM